MKIKIKRIYEKSEESDGYRVLVDRLWPRGISKDSVKIDSWNKEIAPSSTLRKWFGHATEKFDEFKEKYMEELAHNPEADVFKEKVRAIAEKRAVTLLFAAKDVEHNQAVVLAEYLNKI